MSRLAVTFGLVAMLSWGVWTVLAKIATRTIAPETAMIVSYATSIPVALAFLVLRGGEVNLVGRGIGIALLAGLFGGLGAVSFYVGLSYGRTAIVTTVSALYFVVAAVIGILVLGESVATRDAAGIGFAVLAVLLLAR